MSAFSRLLRRFHDAPEAGALVALSSELLGVLDESGRLQPVNGAWERVLGLAPDELNGAPLLTFIHPEDRGRVYEAWQEARAGGRDRPDVKARFCRSDASWAHISWKLSPGSAPGSVLLAGHDISVQARSEETVRLLEPLAQLGRLSLGLVHDVSRLLNLAAGRAALLKSAGLCPEAARDVEGIQEAAKLGGELAADLADAARGGQDAGDSDLNEAALRAQRLVMRLIADARVKTQLDPEAGRVAISSPRLAQVLLNLLMNAWDASGGGVVISTHRTPEGAVLAVSDYGPGISREVRHRVFEPFFTTKAPGKGSGIGLALVHELVLSAGGSVSLRSRPGCGTTVLVSLLAAPGSRPRP
jgi:PAS domain S-box-containing protein